MEAIKWAKALKNKTEVGKNCGPIICQGCVTGGTMITAQIDGDGVPAALSTDNYELVSFLKVFFNLSEDDLK